MQLRSLTLHTTHTPSPTAIVQGELVPNLVATDRVEPAAPPGDMVAADRVEQAAPPAGAAPRFARLKATQKHGDGWGYMSDDFWRDHKGNSDTPPRDWGTGGQ